MASVVVSLVMLKNGWRALSYFVLVFIVFLCMHLCALCSHEVLEVKMRVLLSSNSPCPVVNIWRKVKSQHSWILPSYTDDTQEIEAIEMYLYTWLSHFFHKLIGGKKQWKFSPKQLSTTCHVSDFRWLRMDTSSLQRGSWWHCSQPQTTAVSLTTLEPWWA